MIYRTLLFSAITLCATMFAFAPSRAYAGADGGSPATGVFYSDGSGFCSGTLNGFRTTPAPSDASLTLEEYSFSGGTSGYIMCTYNGNYKYAPLSNSPALLAAFEQIVAMPHEVHVYVHWNTSGFVDALQVFNASNYQ